MPEYSLKTILSTFSNENGKKLTILNASPIGGISSTAIKFFFFALPFIEYGAIFNPYVFNLLGLVTSIVVYIVFMSIIMIIIFFTIFSVKKKIMAKITSSWKHYFNDIDLKMILSSGITPYSDFFKYYSKILKEKPTEEELYTELLKAFEEMQEENKDLILAINKDNQNI